MINKFLFLLWILHYDICTKSKLGLRYVVGTLTTKSIWYDHGLRWPGDGPPPNLQRNLMDDNDWQQKKSS